MNNVPNYINSKPNPLLTTGMKYHILSQCILFDQKKTYIHQYKRHTDEILFSI